MHRFVLAVIFAFAVLASAYGETDCENQRRNSQKSVHGLSWDIQCDSDGNFLPLQCVEEEEESNRWCTCYNKEEAVTEPSRKLRYCQCPLAVDQATKEHADECDIPACSPNGKFEPKQCCPRTGTCYCVDPDSGEQTTEPSSFADLECPTQ